MYYQNVGHFGQSNKKVLMFKGTLRKIFLFNFFASMLA